MKTNTTTSIAIIMYIALIAPLVFLGASVGTLVCAGAMVAVTPLSGVAVTGFIVAVSDIGVGEIVGVAEGVMFTIGVFSGIG
ncbi:MAG: hypothetical protein KAQ68_02115, partial [Clostridiales bacterium]|nr:hypothetical protein [Clostridiales bacterium]